MTSPHPSQPCTNVYNSYCLVDCPKFNVSLSLFLSSLSRSPFNIQLFVRNIHDTRATDLTGLFFCRKSKSQFVPNYLCDEWIKYSNIKWKTFTATRSTATVRWIYWNNGFAFRRFHISKLYPALPLVCLFTVSPVNLLHRLEHRPRESKQNASFLLRSVPITGYMRHRTPHALHQTHIKASSGPGSSGPVFLMCAIYCIHFSANE